METPMRRALVILTTLALTAAPAFPEAGSGTSRPPAYSPPAGPSQVLMNTFLPALKAPPKGLVVPRPGAELRPPTSPPGAPPPEAAPPSAPPPPPEPPPELPKKPLEERFQEANALFDAGKLDAAARDWETLAAEDHAGAMTNLANLLFLGNGVPKDRPAAVRWYHRAAELGNPRAQFNLARLYESGTSVPKSLDEAVRLYRDASARGFERADQSLGRLIANGEIEIEDAAERARILESAAAQGLKVPAASRPPARRQAR
jgi:hypothetical protein